MILITRLNTHLSRNLNKLKLNIAAYDYIGSLKISLLCSFYKGGVRWQLLITYKLQGLPITHHHN